MVALVMIVPLIAAAWDQGFYPHKVTQPPAGIVIPAAELRSMPFDKPYPETITFVTEMKL
jgi:hypothetical protein